jgi:hypothetical protein
VVERVLSDRLQQPVAGCGTVGLSDDESLVDERRDVLKHCPLVIACLHHRNCRVEIEAAPEHCEPAQQPPLGGIEQVIGPVDQRCEGLLAWQTGRAPSNEELETTTEPRVDLGQRECPQSGGRQLEGERNAVELTAQRGD